MTSANLVSKKILQKVFPTREKWSHKGQYGKLLVVAGSKRFTGSPIFNCLSAYRAGCDLVFLAAPQRAADIAASFSPEIISLPLEGDYFFSSHVSQVLDLAHDYGATALLVGGGLWRTPETLDAIRLLLRRTSLPTVIDADGLRAVAQDPSSLAGIRRKSILTPHSKEFEVLAGKMPSTDLKARTKAVENLAKKLETTILLKGATDIISDGKRTAFNETGSPFMTKGGFGDCLAGIAGAFLARGIPPFDAACAAAFVNGKAGEIAAKEKGESLLPSDLIATLASVLRQSV